MKIDTETKLLLDAISAIATSGNREAEMFLYGYASAIQMAQAPGIEIGSFARDAIASACATDSGANAATAN